MREGKERERRWGAGVVCKENARVFFVLFPPFLCFSFMFFRLQSLCFSAKSLPSLRVFAAAIYSSARLTLRLPNSFNAGATVDIECRRILIKVGLAGACNSAIFQIYSWRMQMQRLKSVKAKHAQCKFQKYLRVKV